MATLTARITALGAAIATAINALRASKMDKAGGIFTGPIRTDGGITSPLGDYDITARINSGSWSTHVGSTAKGWPSAPGSPTYYHLLSSTYSSDYYALQFSGPFFDNDYVFVRKVQPGAGADNAWREVAHDKSFQRVYDRWLMSLPTAPTGIGVGGYWNNGGVPARVMEL